MKSKLITLSRRYASGLRKHLKRGRAGSLHQAREVGRQAVRLGLETLDVARIHEGALAELEAASGGDGILKRAEVFFTEAVTPIEDTHRAAIKDNARLQRLNKALDRRTVDVAASNRSLKQSIAGRKRAEAAFEKRGDHSRKLLEESGRLQKHLRQLAHQTMAAQEDKRKKLSHDLQDEIAQTLLAINVRLLSLKKVMLSNARGLRKDIVTTERLVDKSVTMIKRFAREFGRNHEE